ncbi:Rieske (2Fe-2S) protein [Simplicispira psychrophila]|uniref:Rieske (2Fe-2S) protein n=1 Tax=Simplicispira psychrophila TaxID=80882 RepID=UPI0006917E12|nr:Rieske 2Fe-2S domain-containing protein [Simplicispira psychrophila]
MPTPPADLSPATDAALVPLCASSDLVNSGLAVPFDVRYGRQTCRAFAVRFEGQAHAYLNRCTHIAMEMDYQPNQFFDDSGRWLLCATHGATYAPDTGAGVGGPCRGGLVKIALSEAAGVVHWHTAHNLQPVEF